MPGASASTKSASESYGLAAGATMISGSPITRATGVTSPSPTGDLFVSTAPTMTRPIIISSASSLSRRQLPEPDRAAGALDVEDLDVAREAGRADDPLQEPGRGVPAAPGLAGAIMRSRDRSPGLATVPAQPLAARAVVPSAPARNPRRLNPTWSPSNVVVQMAGPELESPAMEGGHLTPSRARWRGRPPKIAYP